MRRMILVVCGVALAVTPPVGAQVSVAIGPMIGYYRPFGKFDPASVYETDLPLTPRDLSGVAWGGGARAWFGRRFGAEVQASFARSTVPVVLTPEGPTGPTPAQVEMVMVQGLLTLAGDPSGHQIWLSAGPGVVQHGGTAYARYAPSAQVAAAVGAGAQIRISRRVLATVGLNTLIYTFDLPLPPELSHNPGRLQHGGQVDALIHLRVAWMLGGS